MVSQKKVVTFTGIFTLVLLAVFQPSTCHPTDGTQCYVPPTDIVFVVDSSSSIWPSNYTKQMDFIQFMVDKFDVGLDKLQVRVAVVTFSDWAMVNIYLLQSKNKSILKWKISLIKQIQGKTNIASALNTLVDRIFVRQNGARNADDVKKIAILLTDGISQRHNLAVEAANRCRRERIELLTIGIGDRIKYDELGELCNRPHTKYLLHVPSYAALLEKKYDVLNKICRNIQAFASEEDLKPDTRRPTDDSKDVQHDAKACSKSQETDLMFIINHELLGINNTEKVVEVVAHIIDLLGHKSPIRTGMMYDECQVTEDIPLGSTQHKFEFLQKIEQLERNTFNNHNNIINYKNNKINNKNYIKNNNDNNDNKKGLAVMLRKLRLKVFSEEELNMKNSRRIGFLFLDGLANLNDFHVIKEVKRSLGNGIQFYVVCIGQQIDTSFIERYIAPREQIIIIPSYNDLQLSLPSKFTEKLCHFEESEPISKKHFQFVSA
ncbi:hypothetical protein Ahia01_000954600 [Argonauta hians]